MSRVHISLEQDITALPSIVLVVKDISPTGEDVVVGRVLVDFEKKTYHFDLRGSLLYEGMLPPESWFLEFDELKKTRLYKSSFCVSVSRQIHLKVMRYLESESAKKN